jgi:hypothetical protein
MWKTALTVTLAIGVGIAAIAVFNHYVTAPILTGNRAGEPKPTGAVPYDDREAVKSEEA